MELFATGRHGEKRKAETKRQERKVEQRPGVGVGLEDLFVASLILSFITINFSLSFINLDIPHEVRGRGQDGNFIRFSTLASV